MMHDGVVDLRMVNLMLDRLAALLRADPAMADRATRWMRGELQGQGVDMPRTGEHAPVRIPGELLERADKLIPAMSRDTELATYGRASRSAVIRLAVLRGLEVLERRYNKP